MRKPAADDPILFQGHGSPRLASVAINSYSLELHGADGELVGDQASQTAFREVLERWRKRARKDGEDLLGKVSSIELTKKELDRAVCREPGVAALVNGAADEFSGQLADVIEHFMRQPSWHAIERIIVGGGFQESRVGERAISRAGVVLRSRGIMVELRTLRHHADDGGLIGWVHLAPRRMLVNGYDAILAIDIGGTNARCGIVRTNMASADDLSEAVVVRRAKWRHADDDPNRKGLIDGLADMLVDMIQYAERKCIVLSPFIGVACPGLIRKDGSIASGAQNLPGDWESSAFHLPSRLRKEIPSIGGRKTQVRLHNDAVVQGLSELPFVQDVARWAVLTIGTGLGNATYTNKSGLPV